MKFRKGDLVKIAKGCSVYLSPNKWYMVDAENGKFPCVDGTISIINPKGMGHIINIENVVDVTSRQNVKEYWKYV